MPDDTTTARNSAMGDWVADWGAAVVDSIMWLGDFGIFCGRIMWWLSRRWPKRETLLPSFYQVGVLSLPVVALTGTFIGMVLAEQSYWQFRQLVKIPVHVPRRDFLSLIANAVVMVGNSSSGTIEAASLGTPVVNVGDRQKCRERNPNVIDVAPVKSEIVAALSKAEQIKRQDWSNVYGEGRAAGLIVGYLATLPLKPEILEKVNAY